MPTNDCAVGVHLAEKHPIQRMGEVMNVHVIQTHTIQIMVPEEDFSSQVQIMSAACDISKENDDATPDRHPIIVDYDSQLSAFGWENFSPPMRDDTTSTAEDAQKQPKGLQRTLSRKFQPCQCSTDSDQTAAKKQKKRNPTKSVSFSNLAIREHAIILGDHPYADKLALALGWEHTEEPTIHDVDTYEKMRQGERRKGESIRMTYVEKRDLLREHGHSESEINRAQRSTILNKGYFGEMQVSSHIRRVKTLAAIQQGDIEL